MNTAWSRSAATTNAKLKLELDGDTDELPLELRNCFQWIVAGNQVGAQWLQPDLHEGPMLRHLGGPSPFNSKDSPLCLWLGLSKTTEELLVLLTHSVKLSSKPRARPRRMFLVVPAESLRIGSCATGFQAVGLNKVPEPLFERPSDERSAHLNGFLHIHFALNSEHGSRVIMPARPYDGQVHGTAFIMLDGLKSLSETQEFDLYLKFNSYAQFDLCNLQQRLDSAVSPYTTPNFDLKGIYRGSRDGGFDLWREQGWHNDKVGLRPRKRKASNGTGTPPPYRPRTAGTEPPAYDGPGTTVSSESEPESARVSSRFACASVLVARSCTPVNCIGENVSPRSEASRVCETPRVVEAVPSFAAAAIPVPASTPLCTRFFEEITKWLLGAWKICPLAHYIFIINLLSLGAAAQQENAVIYQRARVACTQSFISHQADRTVTNDSKQVLDSNPVDPTSVDPITLLCEPSRLIAWMLIVNPSADTVIFDLLIGLEKQRKIVLELMHAGPSNEYTLSDRYTNEEFDRRFTGLLESKALIVAEVCFRYGALALKCRETIVRRMHEEVEQLRDR